jgi:hypothetical protein
MRGEVVRRQGNKLKKVYLIIVSFIVVAGIVSLFLSPISSWLIAKYAREYSGRRVTMDWVTVNPFTGIIIISNLKVYERDNDSIFFSSNAIGARVSVLKSLTGTYEIKRLILNHPRVKIIHNDKDFNFNDLVDKFSSSGNPDTTKKTRLNILNIKIADGEFYYQEPKIPIYYFIKNVNIESSGLRWNSDTTNIKFSFLPGTGRGNVKGDLTVNLKNFDYRIALQADKFDLGIIDQYLKDLTNNGNFAANIDANIKAHGNINDQKNLSASGDVSVNEVHIGKNPKEDFASFDKLELSIVELDPGNLKFIFDSLILIHPSFKYEIYDYLDNLQNIFGKNGENIDKAYTNTGKFNLIIVIARYVKTLADSFFKSNYKIKRLRVYNGDFKFNDFSASEKFNLEFYPLTVRADSIDRNHRRVNIALKSSIRPFGNLSVFLNINPKDSSDFILKYNLKKLPVSLFNPYVISITSFPLERGTLEFNGYWDVRNGIIKSTNHLIILDPRTARRIKNKDLKKIPMPLILTFLREKGNVIDYEIPITGNLKDPKFHLHYIFFDLLRNIFIKPPATPYRLQVKNAEAEIEKSLSLKWETRQSVLFTDQEKFIEKTCDFLIKTPGATLKIYPNQYASKEKEYILFFEAKKKYFLEKNKKNSGSLSAEDSLKIENMSIKDSLFTRYLNSKIKDRLIFTVQEKCTRIVDSAFVNSRFNQLNKERENSFMNYFRKKKIDNRVIILKGDNIVPYNGFSFYKFDYNGDFPDYLIKAYRQMDDLNSEAPRKKFRQERNSIENSTLK